ncbi:MAG: hypothetical protein NVS3B25_09940 [Hymenobacter sp.]
MPLPLAPTKTVTINLTTTEVYPDRFDMAGRPLVTLRMLAAAMEAISGGTRLGTVDIAISVSTGAQASGTLTIASGTGVVGGSINGVAITVTWATSDTVTATALAAAINASTNALVAGIVTASASAGVVTIKTLAKGKVGNSVTLTASGTGVTASGTNLTGGAGADVPSASIKF